MSPSDRDGPDEQAVPMNASWPAALVAEVTASAPTVAGLEQLWLIGSAVTGTYDRWSDVDLGLVLSADLRTEALVASWREIWAVEEQLTDRGQVMRAVLPDGRRIDVVVDAPEEFRGRRDARRVWNGGVAHDPSARLRTTRTAGPDLNRIRFLSVLAAAKLGRGDRLIGAHLTLEVARACLVLAMQLRDRDEATTVHRTGTHRDAAAEQVWRALGDTPDATALIRLAEVVDRLYAERSPGYRADWGPLERLVS